MPPVAELNITGLQLDPQATVEKEEATEPVSEAEKFLLEALSYLRRGMPAAAKTRTGAAFNAICREHGYNGWVNG